MLPSVPPRVVLDTNTLVASAYAGRMTRQPLQHVAEITPRLDRVPPDCRFSTGLARFKFLPQTETPG
jgi:hypothetical protein